MNAPVSSKWLEPLLLEMSEQLLRVGKWKTILATHNSVEWSRGVSSRRPVPGGIRRYPNVLWRFVMIDLIFSLLYM